MASLCNTLSAFTAQTAKNFQLDAGVLVKNMTNPESGDLTGAKYLGATTGGSTFTATPEFRNIFEDVDGARGMYKDGDIIDNWEISFATTLLEMTPENFQLAIGAADITDNADIGGKTVTPRNCVQAADYISNICWCGTIKGSDKPIVIEMLNVINMNGLNFAIEDKGKGGLEVELNPRFDVANPNDVPFKIHIPSIA